MLLDVPVVSLCKHRHRRTVYTPLMYNLFVIYFCISAVAELLLQQQQQYQLLMEQFSFLADFLMSNFEESTLQQQQQIELALKLLNLFTKCRTCNVTERLSSFFWECFH